MTSSLVGSEMCIRDSNKDSTKLKKDKFRFSTKDQLNYHLKNLPRGFQCGQRLHPRLNQHSSG
eukprot:11289693-Prorocentrum_lima.AAC.1